MRVCPRLSARLQSYVQTVIGVAAVVVAVGVGAGSLAGGESAVDRALGDDGGLAVYVEVLVDAFVAVAAEVVA